MATPDRERKPDTARLKILNELTENLPTFGGLVKESRPEFVEMEMECGVGFAWSLLYKRNISVAKCFSSYGSRFPRHSHPELEWIIVYSGTIDLHFDNNVSERLQIGDFSFIKPDTPHSAYFPEDCWYLAITIPAAEDWPQ